MAAKLLKFMRLSRIDEIPRAEDELRPANASEKGKVAKFSKAMERINIGMQVEIKRSDGRIHGAVVTAVNPKTGGVNVEWFEKGETKGKEIDFVSLLGTNPALNPDIIPRISNIDALKGSLRRETILTSNGNGIKAMPPHPRMKSTTVTPIDPDVTFVQSIENVPVPVPHFKVPALPKLPTPKEDLKPILTGKVAFPRAGTQPKLEELSYPPSVSATTKSACVTEVERLAQERDRRRTQLAETKRDIENKKKIDPGNSNWQFLGMICDYRSQVDFRPLRISDAVLDNRISVCVRKRPFGKGEISKKEVEVVTIPNKDHLVVHQPQVKVDLTKYLENQKFRFDYTFDENCDNEIVYKFTAQPLVKTLFEGGYATCFAYGQTGSGKTHTMCGAFQGKSQDCSMGIYALTANDVFRQLQKPQFAKLIVKCSFFELYGGKVFDLLGKRAALRILEDGNKSVQVVGLSEVSVRSPNDVMDLIKKGSAQRSAGTTSANANSSRSHAIFQMILRRGAKEEFYGKISLIDLAGNERGADTNNSDRQTRIEGAEINKSLLALKECIRSMSMNKNYVPFRLSKLTLVLRDSFINENTRTCMIAMVSPGLSCVENTLNTLRYADRVKELGSDEDGPSKPMADADFMYGADLSDEEDLKLIQKSFNDEEALESTMLLNGIMKAQEKAHEYVFQLHDINDRLTTLVEDSQSSETDLEQFASDLIVQSEKAAKTVKALQDTAKDLLQKLQNEQEQTKKRIRK